MYNTIDRIVVFFCKRRVLILIMFRSIMKSGIVCDVGGG